MEMLVKTTRLVCLKNIFAFVSSSEELQQPYVGLGLDDGGA